MISNEQFKIAKKQYKDLISHTLMKYYRVAEPQELKQLANIALWKALIRFDNNKASFSGFLFRMIRWELLSYHRLQDKYITNLKVNKIKAPANLEIRQLDLLDSLNTLETKLFESKFVRRMTLKEIAIENKTHTDYIFNQINIIKDKIKRDLTRQ